MKFLPFTIALILGATEPAFACMVPNLDEDIPVQVSYEARDHGQLAVSVEHPETHDGLAFSGMVVTIHDGDELLFESLIGVDDERRHSGFIIAEHLVNQTEVRVWYGPSESGLCADYRAIQLHKPD